MKKLFMLIAVAVPFFANAMEGKAGVEAQKEGTDATAAGEERKEGKEVDLNGVEYSLLGESAVA
ncbi:MAG: hypothetical protein LBQ26_00070, partial [Holosporales bacterium]|nr:hypothetical protein [Holosporales bacterium]